ncbi:N-acetyltransferase [bacterium]|nr:MAG: N-acetyltransferase [bacterium]
MSRLLFRTTGKFCSSVRWEKNPLRVRNWREVSTIEPIATPRLTVRPFAPSDLDDYLAYQRLPEVRRYLRGAPMSPGAARHFLEFQAEARGDERGRYHAYAVEHRGDQKVIGDVGIFLSEDPSDEGDIGFQFHPAYQGRGYATEAVEALLQHLFNDLDLIRVTGGCDARNLASAGLMERVGMSRVPEGPSAGNATFELWREHWVALPRKG